MKITLVLEGTWPVEIGGVAQWVADLLDWFAQSAPQVRFSVFRIGNPLPDEQSWPYSRPTNVDSIVCLPPTPFPQVGPFEWAKLHLSRLLAQPTDIVHVVGTGLAGALGALAADRGRPLLVSEHASYWQEIQLGLHVLECGMKLPTDTDERVRWVEVFQDVAKRCYRQAWAVTALWQRWADIQQRMGARRTVILPNGLPRRQTLSIEKQGAIHRWISPEVQTQSRHAPSDRPWHVGFVGRWSPVKRPDLFLATARKLMDRFQDLVRIRVVRPHGAPLDDDIEDLGPLGPDTWPDRLDLLLLPSKSEAMPYVLLEAMQNGIPALATDVGACRSLLSDGPLPPAGLVLDLGAGPAHWAERAADVLSSPDTYGLFSRSGPRRVPEPPWLKLANIYEGIFQSVRHRASTRNPDGAISMPAVAPSPGEIGSSRRTRIPPNKTTKGPRPSEQYRKQKRRLIMSESNVTGLILAAGKGSRMRSSLPKVLHEVHGIPMVEYVLKAFQLAGVQNVVVVVGYGADLVRERLGDRVRYAHQKEQLGTGHAVLSARELLENFHGKVLVAYGDMPLISPATLTRLMDLVAPDKAQCSLVTLRVPNPPQAGRILRDEAGQFLRIVEAQDCTPQQLAIDEINVGTYCFMADPLLAALDELRNDNAQGEYYLTDVPEIIRSNGGRVATVDAGDLMEALGVNDPEHLHVAEVQKDISFAESLRDLIDAILAQEGNLEVLLEWDRTRGRLPETES